MMSNYTHFECNAKRCCPNRVRLDPPLTLVSEWCLNGVGYLPKFSEGSYILSFLEGGIRAYDKSTHVLWSFSLPTDYEPFPPSHGNLLISEQTVITRSGGTLFCLDIENGALLAQYTVPEFDLETAIIQNSRIISIFLENREFFCAAYDFAQGRLLWTHHVKEPPDYIAGDENVIVLMDQKGQIVCRDGITGELLWFVQFKEFAHLFKRRKRELYKMEVVGAPIIYEQLVITPLEKDHIAAFELSTGTPVWVRELNIEIPDTTVLYADGNICIADYQSIVTFKAETGEIVKNLQLRDIFPANGIYMPTCFAVTENFFYIADIDEGVLVAVDKQDGSIPWSYDLKTEIPVYKGPTIIGEFLFLAGLHGELFAFSERREF